MSNVGLDWIAGSASVLFPVSAAAALIAAAARIPTWLRPLAVAIALLLVVVVPLRGQTTLTFLFGALGPLSVASLIGSSLILARVFGMEPRCTMRDLCQAAAAVALLGLLLYPVGIGLLPFDPYRAGFHGLALPIILLVLAALGLVLRSMLLPIWISLAILAWLVRLTGSANLWDTLLDPLAWIAAIAFLLERGGRALVADISRATGKGRSGLQTKAQPEHSGGASSLGR